MYSFNHINKVIFGELITKFDLIYPRFHYMISTLVKQSLNSHAQQTMSENDVQGFSRNCPILDDFTPRGQGF